MTATANRFPQIDTEAPADQLERELLARWKAEDLFHTVQRATAKGTPFVFFEGPPTANGKPGIHHVFARTIKDLVCRYQAARGHRVTRIAGWDTHGLPVEIEVEKQLGITSKTEIGDHPGAKVSVAEFNRRCRESVWKYKTDWEQMSDRIGYWLDYDRPYITYSNEYVESVWWLLAQLFGKGLLVKGHKVLPYCPRCGTALSSHELALGYDTAKDPSVYVLYELEEDGRSGGRAVGQDKRYLVVWTTTPWTLASNFAVAAKSDMVYVEVEWHGKRIILAESRLAHVTPGGDVVPLSKAKVVSRFTGEALIGKHYRRPLDVVPWPEGRRWEVVSGDFVTEEDGSGLVHLAPFGADDFAVARSGNFAYAVPVDTAGKFRGTTWPEIEGVFVKDADQAIIAKLKADGLLLKRETVEHTYPFCWRCDTPLLYYPRESWFVRTTAYKDRMLKINGEVQWHPPEIGTGRFGEWLENNVDWALSRDRFWGTPLPVWICDTDGTHVEIVESYAKLAERWGKPLPKDFDPHKPHIDGYTWKCAQCSGTMRRVPEVIDTWFDSGAMPSAQWHYPFEHRTEFEAHFPADFISEGVDQTRGWFYSLMAIAAGVFDRTAYRNVIVGELILDAQGQKMSKSKGNVVDPVKAVERHGADAIRLYLLLSSQVWLPKRFDESQVFDIAGSLLDKLRHTYRTFPLYAGDWKPSEADPAVKDRPQADRWILSRMNATVRTVRAAWDAYDVSAGTRAIAQFVVDDVSNWYVRLNRPRFWNPGGAADPAALATLHEVLCTVAQLLAPAAPFLPDLLHRSLAGTSVFLAAFPEVSPVLDEPALERAMDAVRRLCSLARSAREEMGVKVRQPLGLMEIAVPPAVQGAEFQALLPLLASEVNVKRVELVKAGADLVSLEAVPSFRALGKRFGSATPAAAAAIKELSPGDVARFEAGAQVTIVVQGTPHVLEPGDLTIKRHARGDLVVETDGEMIAALDPALSVELKEEGLARELVSRVQRMRKDAGFDVADRIHLWVGGDEPVQAAARRHAEYIAGETLALAVDVGGAGGEPGTSDVAQDLDLDGVSARIAVRKANGAAAG